LVLKVWESIETPTPKNGSSLGSVRVHSLTFSYIFGNMRCDSWASFLAHTLASPCFGHEPKARVVTSTSFDHVSTYLYLDHNHVIIYNNCCCANIKYYRCNYFFIHWPNIANLWLINFQFMPHVLIKI
jgi:hypothetical protein